MARELRVVERARGRRRPRRRRRRLAASIPRVGEGAPRSRARRASGDAWTSDRFALRAGRTPCRSPMTSAQALRRRAPRALRPARARGAPRPRRARSRRPPSRAPPRARRARWNARKSASLIASRAADEERVGAPVLEEDVGAGDRVERAAVAVAHAHVERAQVFPDARRSRGAVRHRVRELRRIDVARVLEPRDAIELGDRLERAVGVRAADADALRPSSWRRTRAVLLEPRVVEREARRDDEELRQAIERAQPLVAEVLASRRSRAPRRRRASGVRRRVEASRRGRLRVGRGASAPRERREERLAPDAERATRRRGR